MFILNYKSVCYFLNNKKSLYKVKHEIYFKNKKIKNWKRLNNN